jgi:hypothetical protein
MAAPAREAAGGDGDGDGGMAGRGDACVGLPLSSEAACGHDSLPSPPLPSLQFIIITRNASKGD